MRGGSDEVPEKAVDFGDLGKTSLANVLQLTSGLSVMRVRIVMIRGCSAQWATNLAQLGEIGIHFYDGLKSREIVLVMLIQKRKSSSKLDSADLAPLQLFCFLPRLSTRLLLFGDFLLIGREDFGTSPDGV